jgi:hypothetical protein
MNHLTISLTDKQFEYPKGSLVITDEPILKRGEKLFDPAKHGLDPLPMEYREAREFAAAVFPDKDLMTYRNGRRALTRLLMDADRLDRLHFSHGDDDQEAKGVVDDIPCTKGADSVNHGIKHVQSLPISYTSSSTNLLSKRTIRGRY